MLWRLGGADRDSRRAQEDDNLLDYEESDQQATGAVEKQNVKGSYVSMHSTGFRDFLLKPELLKAVGDCGFEHPSEGKRFHGCWRPC